MHVSVQEKYATKSALEWLSECLRNALRGAKFSNFSRGAYPQTPGNHMAFGPLIIMVSRMLCRVRSEDFIEVVLVVYIAMADVANWPNLNLSGKVKGYALGMHHK